MNPPSFSLTQAALQYRLLGDYDISRLCRGHSRASSRECSCSPA